jgi:hypothetical protein
MITYRRRIKEKMKTYKTITLLILFMLTGNYLHAQKVPDPVVKAFQEGNIEVLSDFFNVRLQVNISDHEYMCSKAQAKEIIREFFNNNKPVSFSIIFEGGKEDSNFSIGNLVTNNGNYRVNVFFRKFDGVYLIHLLRIEKDDKKSF